MRQSFAESRELHPYAEPSSVSGFQPRVQQTSGIENSWDEPTPRDALSEAQDVKAPTLPGLTWANPHRVAKLVGLYSRYIYRLLRRFGVPEASLDDATQQVFIIAARKLHDVPEDRERPFLCGTAVRVASNIRRATSQNARRFDNTLLDGLQSQTPDTDALIEQKQARMALDHILNSMTDELRTVFVLCELQGLTAPETALIVDAPLGTVSSRLRRARERFHEEASRIRSELDLRRNSASTASTRRGR